MKLAFTHTEILEKLLVADISPRRYNTDFHENLLKTLHRLPLEDLSRRGGYRRHTRRDIRE